jgi:hypothetical protein
MEITAHATVRKIVVCWEDIKFYLHTENWVFQLSIEIVNQHYVTALVAEWPEFKFRDWHSQKKMSHFIPFNDNVLLVQGEEEAGKNSLIL